MRRSSPSARLRQKGRRVDGTFVALPHAILRSPAFTRLSAHAVKLLLDMLSAYNGGNNGDMSAAWQIMRGRGWKSRDTLAKAIRELVTGGWLFVTRQGGSHVATLYATTIFALSDIPKHTQKFDSGVGPATFPRGAWQGGVHDYGIRSNTPAVSIARSSTRPACQSSVGAKEINTPGVSIKAEIADQSTRRPCPLLDIYHGEAAFIAHAEQRDVPADRRSESRPRLPPIMRAPTLAAALERAGNPLLAEWLANPGAGLRVVR